MTPGPTCMRTCVHTHTLARHTQTGIIIIAQQSTPPSKREFGDTFPTCSQAYMSRARNGSVAGALAGGYVVGGMRPQPAARSSMAQRAPHHLLCPRPVPAARLPYGRTIVSTYVNTHKHTHTHCASYRMGGWQRCANKKTPHVALQVSAGLLAAPVAPPLLCMDRG